MSDVFESACNSSVCAAPNAESLFNALRASVRLTLEHPDIFNGWTVQGFGMLRCYIPGPIYDKQFRLNIWDPTLTVPHVSTIHDHPWHFRSWIINGQFANLRYVEDRIDGTPYEYRVIHTGIEAAAPNLDKPRLKMKMDLWADKVEIYKTGDTYMQRADEIHCSIPAPYTVTLNERTRIGDGEHARVFWPDGQEWVDAKPRTASRDEIIQATALALRSWI